MTWYNAVMSPETISAIVVSAFAVGSFVYAKTRDAMVAFYKTQADKAASDAQASVDAITKEKDHWQSRHEDDRKELHGMREQWNYDKLELERLRTETNFTPIESKLNAFMDGQNRVNEGIVNRLDEMSKSNRAMAQTFGEQTATFIKVMERLVPALSDEEQKKQEEPL